MLETICFVKAIPSEMLRMKKYHIPNFLHLSDGWKDFFMIHFFQWISKTNYYVFCLKVAGFPLFEEKQCKIFCSSILQHLNLK